MTPVQAIAALDRQLAVHGQLVKIRRGTKDAPIATITLDGFVRGFKTSDVVPGSAISQKDSKVVLSPTSLSGWPSPMPKEGDWCEIDGQFRSIVAATTLKIDNVVVRVELQVKG